MSRLQARMALRYPGFSLEVDLDLPLDGVTVVFGPSGCGKTTLLRCLAGLERARGSVRVGNQSWQDGERFTPPHRRPAGFVFQDARLFPHKTVQDNLLYGYRRTPPAHRRLTPERIIDLLDLTPLLERRPTTLSAGEQQRVAIGRALLAHPEVLLMDEPLANLDAARKQDILPFLLRLRRELSIPILYVTHSLEEVLQLVDTLVLLHQGRVQAAGPASRVLSETRPGRQAPPQLAGSLLEATVEAQEPEFGLTRLDFQGQVLYVPQQDLPRGSLLRVHILARDVSLGLGEARTRTSILNILEGTVREVAVSADSPYGVHVLVDVGAPLLASITRKSLETLGLKPGQRVFAQVKALRMVHEWE